MATVEFGDRTIHECEEELLGLKRKLESVPVIEQAKGMLMVRERCNADDAFEMLRRASQRENVKLRDVAARIVRNATQVRSKQGSITA